MGIVIQSWRFFFPSFYDTDCISVSCPCWDCHRGLLTLVARTMPGGALGDFKTPRLSKAAGVTRRTNVRTRSARPVSGPRALNRFLGAAYGGLHPSNYQTRRARSLSLSQEDLSLSVAEDYRREQSTNAEEAPRRLRDLRTSEFLGRGTNRC